MLRDVVFSVGFGLAFAFNAATAGERQRIGLAGQWDFQYLKEATAQPSAEWGRIKQPHASFGFTTNAGGVLLWKAVTIPDFVRG
ncbi:MAG: hypothetical protein PHR35_12240, partial [Kiritimatiellae bacterium]|nr:hypothetical protein [Kiritimatiellia bacterium]